MEFYHTFPVYNNCQCGKVAGLLRVVRRISRQILLTITILQQQ